MLGIIGGTGLYKMESLQSIEKKHVETPFGRPSAEISLGKFENHSVAFLPRHGSHHELLPSEVNYRANLWALKSLGVRRVVSVSAVGSLKESVKPGELAIPDQYFDWTRGKRAASFFGDGIVAHISSAEPGCPMLRGLLETIAKGLSIAVHTKQTYACIEGPRLGTRAESFFLKNNQCTLVGMTNIPEVFLACEAQMCYSTLAVVTDYDCWLSDPSQHVSVEMVMGLYMKSIGKVQEILKKMFVSQYNENLCSCRHSLSGAIVTREIPASRAKLLEVLKL